MTEDNATTCEAQAPSKAQLMEYLKTAELESLTTQVAFYEAQADALRYQIERRKNNQLEGHVDILALVGAVKLTEREMRMAYQVYERIAADYAATADND